MVLMMWIGNAGLWRAIVCAGGDNCGEPKRLKRGKEFHKKIQADWGNAAEGDVTAERSITKPSGRRGRIDVFVECDDELVAIAEIKASNWDAMSEQAVRRNVSRQARQVWSYIESQLSLGKDVSPGMIFAHRPRTEGRLILVEELFEVQEIPVVWDDETIEERQSRDS